MKMKLSTTTAYALCLAASTLLSTRLAVAETEAGMEADALAGTETEALGETLGEWDKRPTSFDAAHEMLAKMVPKMVPTMVTGGRGTTRTTTYELPLQNELHKLHEHDLHEGEPGAEPGGEPGEPRSEPEEDEIWMKDDYVCLGPDNSLCSCYEPNCNLDECTYDCHCFAGGCSMAKCTHDCVCWAPGCTMNLCEHDCGCVHGFCKMDTCTMNCDCPGSVCEVDDEDWLLPEYLFLEHNRIQSMQ